LAEYVGLMIADGHLSKDLTSYTLYATEAEIQKRFSYLTKKIFGFKTKITYGGKNSYRMLNGRHFRGKLYFFPYVPNSVAAKTLYCLGVPPGDKVTRDFDVPSWIMQGSKSLKKAFLRGLFSCDGSKLITNRKNKAYVAINYKINKISSLLDSGFRFLNNLRHLLSAFSIQTSKVYCENGMKRKRDGQPSLTLFFYIRKHVSILNFSKNIGYIDPNKQQSLDNVVNRLTSRSKALLRIQRLNKLHAILKRHPKGLTEPEISDYLGMSISATHDFLYRHARDFASNSGRKIIRDRHGKIVTVEKGVWRLS
jgi:intein/homing endonuclease